jgi:hypothetical protein
VAVLGGCSEPVERFRQRSWLPTNHPLRLLRPIRYESDFIRRRNHISGLLCGVWLLFLGLLVSCEEILDDVALSASET